MSSLDLVKRVVHVTASASVTNACHFRHALALDEHRVKFMPEYFSEVNALRNDIRSPRAPRTAISDGQEVDDGQEVGDVKEVWFAGGHADVYVIHQYISAERMNLMHFHVQRWDEQATAAY